MAKNSSARFFQTFFLQNKTTVHMNKTTVHMIK